MLDFHFFKNTIMLHSSAIEKFKQSVKSVATQHYFLNNQYTTNSAAMQVGELFSFNWGLLM